MTEVRDTVKFIKMTGRGGSDDGGVYVCVTFSQRTTGTQPVSPAKSPGREMRATEQQHQSHLGRHLFKCKFLGAKYPLIRGGRRERVTRATRISVWEEQYVGVQGLRTWGD